MQVPQPCRASPERRTYQRTGAGYRAVVRFANGDAHPCRIKNISPMGALLELGPGIEPPAAFRLTIPDALFAADCELRHQTGRQVGVLFTSGRMEALARFG